MACKQGIRKNIEESKKYYAEQRNYNPLRELWSSLVERVYHTEEGFGGLSPDEQTYFAVNVLDGEVYNGGMDQFFWNSSGGLYSSAVDGLLELKATNSLQLLLEAGRLIFAGEVPEDWEERRQFFQVAVEGGQEPAWVRELERVDRQYWLDSDQLGEKLAVFAKERGLIQPFETDHSEKSATVEMLEILRSAPAVEPDEQDRLIK